MDVKKIILLIILALFGAGGGVAIPIMLGLTASGGGSDKSEDGEAGTAGTEEGGEDGVTGNPDEARFIVFDRMVMNLNDPALIKYLTLEIVMRVDARDEMDIRGLIEKKKPMLKDRLTTLVADKTLEDVMGRVGINRLRREVLDEFNKILFPDGIYLVHEVLFDEWHVD